VRINGSHHRVRRNLSDPKGTRTAGSSNQGVVEPTHFRGILSYESDPVIY
jgi:hypothetical protein